MKTLTLAAGFALVLGCDSGSLPGRADGTGARANSPAANAPAPDFTLEDLDGKEVKLSALRGKGVLLNFWFLG